MQITTGNSWPINFRLKQIIPAKFITICRAAFKKTIYTRRRTETRTNIPPLNSSTLKKSKTECNITKSL